MSEDDQRAVKQKKGGVEVGEGSCLSVKMRHRPAWIIGRDRSPDGSRSRENENPDDAQHAAEQRGDEKHVAGTQAAPRSWGPAVETAACATGANTGRTPQGGFRRRQRGQDHRERKDAAAEIDQLQHQRGGEGEAHMIEGELIDEGGDYHL